MTGEYGTFDVMRNNRKAEVLEENLPAPLYFP
jgi:hypothetical protein